MNSVHCFQTLSRTVIHPSSQLPIFQTADREGRPGRSCKEAWGKAFDTHSRCFLTGTPSGTSGKSMLVSVRKCMRNRDLHCLSLAGDIFLPPDSQNYARVPRSNFEKNDSGDPKAKRGNQAGMLPFPFSSLWGFAEFSIPQLERGKEAALHPTMIRLQSTGGIWEEHHPHNRSTPFPSGSNCLRVPIPPTFAGAASATCLSRPWHTIQWGSPTCPGAVHCRQRQEQ